MMLKQGKTDPLGRNAAHLQCIGSAISSCLADLWRAIINRPWPNKQFTFSHIKKVIGQNQKGLSKIRHAKDCGLRHVHTEFVKEALVTSDDQVGGHGRDLSVTTINFHNVSGVIISIDFLWYPMKKHKRDWNFIHIINHLWLEIIIYETQVHGDF